MVYMDFLAEYNRKKRTPEEAVSVVKSGDWVDYTSNVGFPYLLDRALAARRDELHDVKIRGNLCLAPSRPWNAIRRVNTFSTIRGTAAPMRDSCATKDSAIIFP